VLRPFNPQNELAGKRLQNFFRPREAGHELPLIGFSSQPIPLIFIAAYSRFSSPCLSGWLLERLNDRPADAWVRYRPLSQLRLFSGRGNPDILIDIGLIFDI